MNKILKLSVIALGLAALPAFSQSTQTIGASIKVITPITFTAVSPLNFGTVSVSNNASSDTYTLTTAGACTHTAGAGNGVKVTDTGNPPAAGAALMHSEAGFRVNLAAVVTTQMGGGTTLSNLTVGGAAGTTFPTFVASPAATTALTFGADATVPNTTVAGIYNLGVITLTATYN